MLSGPYAFKLFIDAIENSQEEEIEHFLTTPYIIEHLADQENLALKTACSNGLTKIVKTLLTYPAVRDGAAIADIRGSHAPLRCAIGNGDIEIVIQLLLTPAVSAHFPLLNNFSDFKLLSEKMSQTICAIDSTLEKNLKIILSEIENRINTATLTIMCISEKPGTPSPAPGLFENANVYTPCSSSHIHTTSNDPHSDIPSGFFSFSRFFS